MDCGVSPVLECMSVAAPDANCEVGECQDHFPLSADEPRYPSTVSGYTVEPCVNRR